jgi:hypothetical protein
MSCHGTPGNRAATSLACALTHTPSDDVSRLFHQLKRETPDGFPEPTLQEVIDWLERAKFAVRSDDTLSAWRQERLLEAISEAITTAQAGSLPDTATWYAWQNLRAACDEGNALQWLVESSGSELPITEMTPAGVDEKLADAWDKVYGLLDRQAMLRRDVDFAVRNLGRYGVTEESLVKRREKLAEIREQIDAAVGVTEPFEAEYVRRSGWARYFRVVTSGEGHVHSSRNCHSCYPTTRYGWLPSLSGKGELEAVDEYGSEMCSHCFPTVLNHPRYQSRGRVAEAQAAARQAERDARQAAKAAKGITTSTGGEVRIGRRRNESIRTEVTAERTLVDKLHSIRGSYSEEGISAWTAHSADPAGHRARLLEMKAEAEEDAQILLEALAFKRNMNIDEIRSAMEAKADARIAKERRAAARRNA